MWSTSLCSDFIDHPGLNPNGQCNPNSYRKRKPNAYDRYVHLDAVHKREMVLSLSVSAIVDGPWHSWGARHGRIPIK